MIASSLGSRGAPRFTVFGGVRGLFKQGISMGETSQKREKPLTVGQVAKIAGIKPCTVWHHIKTGSLRAYRWEERAWYYVEREDLDRWMSERKARRLRGDFRIVEVDE